MDPQIGQEALWSSKLRARGPTKGNAQKVPKASRHMILTRPGVRRVRVVRRLLVVRRRCFSLSLVALCSVVSRSSFAVLLFAGTSLVARVSCVTRPSRLRRTRLVYRSLVLAACLWLQAL